MGIGLFVLATALGLAAGRPLVRSLSAASAWERWLFQIPLGLGVLAYVVLAAGWSGFVRAPVFWGLAAAVAAIAWGISLRIPKGKSVEPLGQRQLVGALSWMAPVAFVAIGALTLIGALAPPAGWEWDSLSYQLAAPKAWVLAGRIHYLPYDHHSNFPFTWNMLYLWMLASGSIAAAKLFHWLCGLLLCAMVAVFARRHLKDGHSVGLAASLAFVSLPLVVWESTTAYVDLATALFTWMSVHALVNAADDVQAGREGWAGSLRWLMVSAVSMGFALGTKMTCLVFLAMGFVGIVLWQPVLYRRFDKRSLSHAIAWASLATAVGSVWYVKTWIWTGNPVYPFFWSIFGGKFWNAENAARYAADQAAFGFGKGIPQAFFAPWDLTMERSLVPPGRGWVFTEYVDFGLSPFLVAFLAPLLLLWRRREPAVGILVLFGLGVLASWFVLMQQTRYLLPALPGFALAAAAAWAQASPLVRRFGLGLLGVCCLWAVVRGFDIAMPAWAVVTGGESEDRYLGRRLGPISTAQQWVNNETPADSKVLLVDEPRGFWLDRPYAWAEPNHAAGLFGWETFADSADMSREMRRRGYDWVIWNRANAPQDPSQTPERWRSLFYDAMSSGELAPAAEFGPALVLRFRQEDRR
jgi:hypothetical protein